MHFFYRNGEHTIGIDARGSVVNNNSKDYNLLQHANVSASGRRSNFS